MCKILAISQADLFQSDKTNVLKAIESILCISVAVVFGVVLGYYYKEPSAKMLRLALNEPSEWKKNLFLDWRRAKTSFFELKNNLYGGFEFNWIAFSIGITKIRTMKYSPIWLAENLWSFILGG